MDTSWGQRRTTREGGEVQHEDPEIGGVCLCVSPLDMGRAISSMGEVHMKEGAWINATTGDYRWLDEHARWLQ